MSPVSAGPKECPVYPTELAFALDTAAGGNADTFNRMKDTVVSIVNNITIAESNCPRGARVALVTYNSEVTTEIRFADSRKKNELVKQIKDLQFVQTSKQRSLETAMGFVARNTFKRARSGFLMRKVAVFFTNGPTRASPRLNEAVLRLYISGVVPVFLTNREDRVLNDALQVCFILFFFPLHSLSRNQSINHCYRIQSVISVFQEHSTKWLHFVVFLYWLLSLDHWAYNILDLKRKRLLQSICGHVQSTCGHSLNQMHLFPRLCYSCEQQPFNPGKRSCCRESSYRNESNLHLSAWKFCGLSAVARQSLKSSRQCGCFCI